MKLETIHICSSSKLFFFLFGWMRTTKESFSTNFNGFWIFDFVQFQFKTQYHFAELYAVSIKFFMQWLLLLRGLE